MVRSIEDKSDLAREEKYVSKLLGVVSGAFSLGMHYHGILDFKGGQNIEGVASVAGGLALAAFSYKLIKYARNENNYQSEESRNG